MVLTHLQPWNEPDDAFTEAAAAFGGDLEIAFSGQAIDLAPAPAG